MYHVYSVNFHKKDLKILYSSDNIETVLDLARVAMHDNKNFDEIILISPGLNNMTDDEYDRMKEKYPIIR